MRKLMLGVVLAASAVTFTNCGGDDDDCTIGAERCMCTTAGTCGPGLQCLSGICVAGGNQNTGGMPGTGTALASFIGQWQYVAGTQNVQCPMLNSNDTEQLTGQKFRISSGVDAPLVVTYDSDPCVWKFDANGQVMTVRGNQTCMANLNVGGTVVPTTIVPVSATMTVTGTTATVAFSENYTLNVNGAIVNCMGTTSGNATKISN